MEYYLQMWFGGLDGRPWTDPVGILVKDYFENREDLIFVDHEGLPATNSNHDSKETNDPLNQSHRLSFQIPS